jgi:hypothetical protein
LVIIEAPKETHQNIDQRPPDDRHLGNDDLLVPLVSIKITTICPKELGNKSPSLTIQNPQPIIYVAQTG